MNENLDLTKILEGCPKGTKFYSTIYGEVSFNGIFNNSVYPIGLISYTKQDKLSANIYITKEGRMGCNYNGECTLFPSRSQRDWSKFKRFWDKPNVERFDINTLQPFDKIIVRNRKDRVWTCEMLSYIGNTIGYLPVIAMGDCYRWCIPYNDETKHLVGTREDCPEFYKWWEDEEE